MLLTVITPNLTAALEVFRQTLLKSYLSCLSQHRSVVGTRRDLHDGGKAVVDADLGPVLELAQAQLPGVAVAPHEAVATATHRYTV